MDETITKASDTKIRVTKVIPEQTIEKDYSIEEVDREINRLKEEIRMDEQMIANDEENTQRQIREARNRVEIKKTELATWEARKVEAEKILPKDGVCSQKIGVCEVGNATKVISSEKEDVWDCEGINGGLTAPCSFLKPVVEEVIVEEIVK
jgi:hypothetical protein